MYKSSETSSWIDMHSRIGGRAVNFIIKLDFDAQVVDISDNIYQLSGYKKDDLLAQKSINDIIHPEDMKDLYLKIHKNLLSKHRQTTYIFRIITPKNNIINVEAYLNFKRNRKNNTIEIFGYFIDITEKKSFQNKINYLTNFDELTGLVNRQKLKQYIDLEFVKNFTQERASALLYLDLNRFKNINDTLGHHIGDKLLQHVAHRLKSVIKEDDILSRVGDDEFVILLTDLNKKTFRTHVEIIAKRVYNIIKRPFSIEENLMHISTSIGVSILSVDGTNADEVLNAADTAMYLAKTNQNSYIKYFQKDMNSRHTLNIEIEKDLRIAILNNEFELYYQPQVDTEDGHMVGAEALIRWHHPKNGLVSPLQFIPIAEKSDLIVDIGAWVLQEACKRIKEIEDSPYTPKTFKKISVNISSKQFERPSFISDVKKVIKKSGINPIYLELEVTEGALMANLDDAIEKMLILKELGIKFSIDDFGTGYSSLTYLKKLPVDIIKIDKSFISNMHTDNDDKILTQTIIQMSKNLKLSLIAEGVENSEHLDFLQEKGCESYQGYLFSKPLPFTIFKKLLYKDFLAEKEKTLLPNTTEA